MIGKVSRRLAPRPARQGSPQRRARAGAVGPPRSDEGSCGLSGLVLGPVRSVTQSSPWRDTSSGAWAVAFAFRGQPDSPPSLCRAHRWCLGPSLVGALASSAPPTPIRSLRRGPIVGGSSSVADNDVRRRAVERPDALVPRSLDRAPGGEPHAQSTRPRGRGRLPDRHRTDPDAGSRVMVGGVR